PHAAEEVYVTGTFDNWEKTEQLEKVGDVFKKTVTLPNTSDKILYKLNLVPRDPTFVVDGNWTTDHTAPQEKDHEGNENNVLLPENITKMADANPAAATAAINTVGPESTTAQLAGEKPAESDAMSPPGGYPETPATELDKQVKIDPIPATDFTAPPIKLAPGEKIPEGVVAGSINDHVTLDKESYEKSDRLPGLETSDAPLFQLPPITNDMIPESSLPIVSGGDAAISSVAPDATTAKLAGEVPLEPTVPEIVKESQKAAHVDPEASAISEEVKEKAAVEEELLKKVPEAPAASENVTTLAEAVVAASAVVATAAVGAAIVAKDTVDSAVETTTQAAAVAVEKLPEPVKEILPTATQQKETPVEPVAEPVAADVPATVKESIAEASASPEAATSTTAVEEKKEVEAELLKEVKPVEPISETVKPEESTPVAAAPPVAEPATNGTKAVAAPEESTSKSADAPTTTAERKKKNRLSSIFSKIKQKFADKS
ncbi:putative carbohydrate-binding module family 48 protein, partial [Rhypophila decipiens]